MAGRLFSKSCTPDDMLRHIADARFMDCVYVVVGIRERWDAALDELAEAFETFRHAGRDDEPLYRVFDLLTQRALESPDTVEMLDAMGARLNFYVPQHFRADKMQKKDPLHWVDEKNFRWLESYKQAEAALRGERWSEQQKQSLLKWRAEQTGNAKRYVGRYGR